MLQIVTSALALWAATRLVATARMGLANIGLAWLLCAVAIDELYWSVARAFAATGGGWEKFEFEHDWIVVLIKANVFVALVVWFLAWDILGEDDG